MIKTITRTLAFTSNWMARVLREPSTILLMIVGPFLVLFLFGIGTAIQELPPKTIVVRSGTTEPPFDVTPQQFSAYLDVIKVTDDFDQAMSDLSAGQARLVLVLPEQSAETIQSGRHAVIQVYTNEIDPVRLAFIRIDLQAQVNLVNNGVQANLVDSAKDEINRDQPQLSQIQQTARTLGVSSQDLDRFIGYMDTFRNIPTDVLVAPFQTSLSNTTPVPPTVVAYFMPSALALIIQHLAVTLAALSLVRARYLGTIELWQTAPVRLGEIVAGNYISYGLLTAAITVVLVMALIWALTVAVAGSVYLFWITVALLLLASLGIGFVISLLATTEQSAAQLAMIILLASIFLGGLVVPVDQITMPIRVISYLLPATYASQILHDIVQRGATGDPIYYAALAAIALLGLVVTLRLFHGQLKPT